MKFIRIYIVLSVLFTFSVAVSAQELTAKQVEKHMAAAGQVFAARSTMDGIDKACEKFVADINSTWISHNGMAILKAKKLRNDVFKLLEKHKGKQSVATLKNKQDEFLQAQVATIINKISSLPEGKKKQSCAKFKQTVLQGKWDVKNNPGLYSYLMNN